MTCGGSALRETVTAIATALPGRDGRYGKNPDVAARCCGGAWAGGRGGCCDGQAGGRAVSAAITTTILQVAAAATTVLVLWMRLLWRRLWQENGPVGLQENV